MFAILEMERMQIARAVGRWKEETESGARICLKVIESLMRTGDSRMLLPRSERKKRAHRRETCRTQNFK